MKKNMKTKSMEKEEEEEEEEPEGKFSTLVKHCRGLLSNEIKNKVTKAIFLGNRMTQTRFGSESRGKERERDQQQQQSFQIRDQMPTKEKCLSKLGHSEMNAQGFVICDRHKPKSQSRICWQEVAYMERK
ncbi:hypothetical protein RUM44_011060 [Polyplax serrata]|uniref:Uncharacterized protein n=1 Tax=Polyplax serrata TaxID=468196 RepID=A0ABR1AP05_POLSC